MILPFPSRFLGLLWVLGALVGCSKANVSDEVVDEIAQQVGDVMASMDEVGGPAGTLSQHQNSFLKMQDSLEPHFSLPGLLPEAHAASCLIDGAFSMCSASTRTMQRNFHNCTLGLATFNGSVSLNWSGSGSGCSLGLPSSGGSITRVPDFSVTGLRGATLHVQLAPGAVFGQKLSYVAGSGVGPNAQFKFSSDGIRRVFTLADETPLIDLTTLTSSDLTLTGSDRADAGRVRTLDGGVLKIKNNLSDFSCDFSPTQVKWTSNCNCPVSGTWQASCSDGTSSTIELTGCGSAQFTFGAETQTVSFDRCVQF